MTFGAVFPRALRPVFGPGLAVSAGLTTLFYDTFTDADGVALTSHTPDVGSGWISDGGIWTISGNKATVSTYPTPALCDVGVSDYTITAGVVVGATSSSYLRGIVMRYETASQFYRIGLKFSAGRFGVYAGGSLSALAETTFTVTPGVEYLISATISGSTIIATVNGGNQVTYTSATLTGSICGLSGRLSTDSVDNFLVQV